MFNYNLLNNIKYPHLIQVPGLRAALAEATRLQSTRHLRNIPYFGYCPTSPLLQPPQIKNTGLYWQ